MCPEVRWLATNALGCAEGPGATPDRGVRVPDLGPGRTCAKPETIPAGLQRASDPVSMVQSPAPSSAPQGDACANPGVREQRPPAGPREACSTWAARRPAAQNCRPTASAAQKAVGAIGAGGLANPAPLSVRPRSAASAPATESESRCAAGDRPGGGTKMTHLLASRSPAPAAPPQPGLSLESVRPALSPTSSAQPPPRPPRPCNLLLTSPPIRNQAPRGGAETSYGSRPYQACGCPEACLPTCPRPPTPSHPRQALPLVEERGTIWEISHQTDTSSAGGGWGWGGPRLFAHLDFRAGPPESESLH